MKVKIEIVDFEADLDELLKICEILKKQLRKEHRKELKELLDEINEIYEIIVNALNAFEEIPYKDPEFTKKFANRRAAFSKQYMMDKETVGYRCSEVKSH